MFNYCIANKLYEQADEVVEYFRLPEQKKDAKEKLAMERLKR